jgi:hypothetical protein
MSPYHGLCSELVAANLYVLQAPTSDLLATCYGRKKTKRAS